MNTRLEIFIDGVWKTLELFDKASIKYNKVINKIASIDTREISHSNTLSIPTTYHNKTVLGINVFNKQQLSKALNSRYEAKYYIDEKIVNEGFIVINRSDEEDIKVNFIDTSLEIVDLWGSLSFRQLLNDPSLSIPADYASSIVELKGYTLLNSALAPIVGEVGTKGYNLCLFPNNLNAIGDKYMLDAEESRPDNSICPYQSRPLYNAKALFDLACEAFGFTPIFDPSVDWDDVADTYMVANGLGNNFVDDGVTTVFSTLVYNPDTLLVDSAVDRVAIQATASKSEQPNNITGWVDPESGWIGTHLDENVIFEPDLELQANGVIRYNVNHTNGDTTLPDNCYGVWENAGGTGVVFKTLLVENAATIGTNVLEFDINKVQLFDPPTGAGEFKGVLATVNTAGTILNYQITETFIPISSVSYDELGQFESQSIDLTYAAPSNNIKSLLLALMSQFGILMNIDSLNKEITFFNYSRYLTKRFEGEFTDLSDYLLEHEPKGYNTDFGNSFGKLNEVSLSSPFRGNTFFVSITNQGNDSKLKDFSENKSKIFKDVTQVNRIPNTATPYVEYTNQGLGLIKYSGTLDDLTQVKFIEEPTSSTTFTTQGTLTGVPSLINFSLSFIPSGVSEWYRLVQESIKARPRFLLPIDVVRNLDLTLPVYIEQLGGFYIVEEVGEYENPQEIVTIQVIKLIDGAEFSDDFSEDFNI